MLHDYAFNGQALRVGVIGGSGYAGLELVRLLLRHPSASLRICFSAKSDFSFADYLPVSGTRRIPVAPLSDLDRWLHDLDTVFLATPIEASLELAGRILAAGVNVVDLSGAFRLPDGDYDRWYGLKHPCPDLIPRAEYGLVPWTREDKQGPRLIANPGCYATSVLMAILPLLKRNLIRPETLVIDAKSGTSGAGRKPSETLLFTEVEGECLPYRVGKHQHLPEIAKYAKQFGGGTEISPMFTTHLLGIRRGILSGIYARTTEAVTPLDLTSAYAEDYSDYGLVEWGAIDDRTARSSAFSLSLKRVVGTGLTRIQFALEGDRLYLFSLIDNLIKGAAGQAVENFNRIHALAPSTGLKELEGIL